MPDAVQEMLAASVRGDAWSKLTNACLTAMRCGDSPAGIRAAVAVVAARLGPDWRVVVTVERPNCVFMRVTKNANPTLDFSGACYLTPME
ncbi:hypothetical protein BcepSauron_315 [Burkholderia phage BcepSauron]|uniref:Uncharacterized protein n=1 Tax=Burkholderia phage BcepSauron TaxID=2530033 RepID=A0A482MM03_9CAUD|nr:hypothetical protein H1O17_gp315 [Burkholderia phage BcepSauron]QBQ74695.1 hypothetical protein BcepSauron_315 [Burkholderia phage BcepSauron]